MRGKEGKNVEFGAKAQVSNVDGFVFLDDCQYDTFNEGIRLPGSLEKHLQRFGKLPNETLGDQIYATRHNRALLGFKGIQSIIGQTLAGHNLILTHSRKNEKRLREEGNGLAIV